MKKQTRKKRSILYTHEKEILEMVKAGVCKTRILRNLGLSSAGNYNTLSRVLKEWGAEAVKCGYKVRSRVISDEDALIENSPHARQVAKRVFLKRVEYKCTECGIEGEYNGKPLSLHLDHINGIRNDNRIENLRLLCPNCHSQTGTYSGKALKKEKIPRLKPPRKPNASKVELPPKEELEKLYETNTVQQLVKIYNISSATISKWMKHYEIEVRTRGHGMIKKS